MRKLLVVGASGSIGSEVVSLFGRLQDWQVYALSRHAPELDDDVHFTHLAVNLENAAECASSVAALDISHVVYAALIEAPGLLPGWSDADTMQRNLAMLHNIVGPIAVAGSLQHVIAMQGTKAYGAHLHPIALPARESQPRDPHANFYFLQEDYLRALRARTGCTWTVFRPQIVFSGAVGVFMNPISVIAAYAALCAQENRPCGYPGSGDTIWEVTDARLIARACAWAFEHTTGEERIYNIANGDVWVIPHQWPTLCALLGVEAGPARRFDFATMAQTQAQAWEKLVAHHQLRPVSLAQFLGQSHHYLNLLLGNLSAQQPPAALVSTIKIRSAGFGDCIDTDASAAHWIDALQRRRWLPPVGRRAQHLPAHVH
jgi:nucleoside-diphosphate-sugar epimerase